MKTALALLAIPALAAWDGPGMWYRAADDANPGGGGITGTGGAHDHGISCLDCHMDRPDEPDLKLELAFAPSRPMIGDQPTYLPGQRYTVTVILAGAQVGCAPGFTTNTDGFALTFEDDTGATAGMLESDSGQSAASCPADASTGGDTTQIYSDCKVVIGQGANRDTWTFAWTAPSAGAVHIHYGAVDGNCDMMSMRDAVTVGTETMPAPSFARTGFAVASLFTGLPLANLR
jgi:hypothetical protein